MVILKEKKSYFTTKQKQQQQQLRIIFEIYLTMITIVDFRKELLAF